MGNSDNKAFTLLEVMIFVTILSVVLITSASFITRLLFNLKMNEHRAIANFYVDDLREWLNGERDRDWNELIARSNNSPGAPGTPPGNSLCVNSPLHLGTTEITSLPEGQCTSYDGIAGVTQPMYKRELFLYNPSDTSSVTATIRISWLEVGRPAPVTIILQTIYTSRSL